MFLLLIKKVKSLLKLIQYVKKKKKFIPDLKTVDILNKKIDHFYLEFVSNI